MFPPPICFHPKNGLVCRLPAFDPRYTPLEGLSPLRIGVIRVVFSGSAAGFFLNRSYFLSEAPSLTPPGTGADLSVPRPRPLLPARPLTLPFVVRVFIFR